MHVQNINKSKNHVAHVMIEVPVESPEWDAIHELLAEATFKGCQVQYCFSFVEKVVARCAHPAENCE